MNIEFTNIDIALEEFRKGGLIIVVDDESRENEGDLIVAAEHLTQDQMTFIINHSTGIICVPMLKDLAHKLELDPMVINNTENHQTAFTVSCDSIHTTTGVSSLDRTQTVKDILHGNPSNLSKPGHMFPLVARDGLLKVRQGHTEASVNLCVLCGLRPVAVISELKNLDGTMKNRKQNFEFAKEHGLPIISIDQIIKYVNNNHHNEHNNTNANNDQDHKMEWLSECDFTNEWGQWTLRAYPSKISSKPHIVLIKNININHENDDDDDFIPVRIHSECFTGDILGSYLCDCGSQLDNSMKYIENKNKGIVIYANGHEGRGIGLTDKIKAYKLQMEENLNTYDANNRLGHPDDTRDYDEIVKILLSLNVKNIHLLTNNPSKIDAVNKYFTVTYEPITGYQTRQNAKYLNDKKKYFERQNMEYQKKILNSIDGLPNKEDSAKYSIGLVTTMWHRELIDIMRDNTIKELNELGIIHISEYRVPGCFEIPYMCSQIADKHDCIICLGILIKGDTLHFDNVATAVTNGIMQVQLDQNVPIVDAILPCFNLEQVMERIDSKSELAKSYALTALHMAGI